MDGSARPSAGDGGDFSRSDRQQFGELVINRVERRVLIGDREVHLTPSEFRLLSTLAAEPQRAFSSRELLETMWESRWRASTAPLQIHVSRLRKKLANAGAERNFLTTIHGFGYRFNPGSAVFRDDPPQDDPTVGSSTIQVLLSADHKILWTGANVQDHLGWRPSDLLGRSVYSLVHPDDMYRAIGVQSQLDAGKSAEFRGRVATADGRFRTTQFLIRPIRDGQDDGQMFLGEWRPAVSTGETQGDSGISMPLVQAESSEASAETVRLFFDHDLTLLEISPHVEFLGFDPDAIIGNLFSPAGLTRDQMNTTIRTLIDVGQLMVDSGVMIIDAAGHGHVLRVVSRLLVGDGQEFLGLDSTIYLTEPPK